MSDEMPVYLAVGNSSSREIGSVTGADIGEIMNNVADLLRAAADELDRMKVAGLSAQAVMDYLSDLYSRRN